METKTYVYNQRGQWKAETNVKIEGSDRVLKISTWKNSNKRLVTQVTVATVENGFETFVVFQDYYRTWIATQPKVVNEKRVTEQQRAAVDDLDIILADVVEFYARKEVTA